MTPMSTQSPPQDNVTRASAIGRVIGQGIVRLIGLILGLFKRRQTIVMPMYFRQKRNWLLNTVLVMGLSFFCLIYGFIYAIVTPYLLVQMLFPIVLLAGLVLWALPETGNAPTTLMSRLFFAFFIAMIAWPNYLAISLPGLPWITMVRLTGIPLTLIFLLGLSISKQFRQDLLTIVNANTTLWKLLVAFVVLQVISVAFSSEPATSINQLIVTQISWTAIFFVSAYVFTTPGRAEFWTRVLWFLVIAMCMLGLRENQLGKLLWAGHIPSFLAVDDESVQHTLAGFARAGGGRYRVLGTFSTSLAFAEFLALATPFILHRAMSSYRLVERLAAAATLPLILWVLVLTDSRLGMVGYFVSCLLYILLWSALRWNRDRTSLVAPAIVIAYPLIFCAMVAATFVIQRLRVAIWGGSQHSPSNDARVDQFSHGIKMILTHPWGYGIGRGAESLNYRNPSGDLTIDTYYLLIGLEYGVVGFILYYGFLVLAIAWTAKHAIRRSPEREESFLIPIAIAMTSFFIIKSVYSGTGNHSLIYMMIGMSVALIHRSRLREAAPQASESQAIVPAKPQRP